MSGHFSSASGVPVLFSPFTRRSGPELTLEETALRHPAPRRKLGAPLEFRLLWEARLLWAVTRGKRNSYLVTQRRVSLSLGWRTSTTLQPPSRSSGISMHSAKDAPIHKP